MANKNFYPPVPEGLRELTAQFGSIDDPNFERDHIISFPLPYPLLYGGKAVHSARAHKLVVPAFAAVFTEILAAGLQPLVTNYGGIYNDRLKRGSKFPSVHCFGVAIDLEPEKYPLHSTARFDPRVVAIFQKHGFFYGGDFQGRKDPMHFQYATGY